MGKATKRLLDIQNPVELHNLPKARGLFDITSQTWKISCETTRAKLKVTHRQVDDVAPIPGKVGPPDLLGEDTTPRTTRCIDHINMIRNRTGKHSGSPSLSDRVMAKGDK